MSVEDRLGQVKGTEPGQFRVTVENWHEELLEWEGYAESISDALYKALNKREAQLEEG